MPATLTIPSMLSPSVTGTSSMPGANETDEVWQPLSNLPSYHDLCSNCSERFPDYSARLGRSSCDESCVWLSA